MATQSPFDFFASQTAPDLLIDSPLSFSLYSLRTVSAIFSKSIPTYLRKTLFAAMQMVNTLRISCTYMCVCTCLYMLPTRPQKKFWPSSGRKRRRQKQYKQLFFPKKYFPLPYFHICSIYDIKMHLTIQVYRKCGCAQLLYKSFIQIENIPQYIVS